MNRTEHLQWCKDRAIQYADAGDCSQAIASFVSDMRKHPETENYPALELMAMMMFGGHLKTPSEVRKFILGFN